VTTRIVLIRHGQTVWNRENRFRGQLDPELDETGLLQAQATGRYVAARWPVAAVYSSPLRRALQTAEVVAQAQGLVAQPFQGLLDIHFGELHGLGPAEALQRWPDVVRAWQYTPQTVHFPGGESLDDVRRRLSAGLDELVARHRGQTLALVSHTVANRVLLCAVMGWGNEYFWRLEQDTCAVNVFDIRENGMTVLVVLNDTSHQQSLAVG